MFYKNVNKTSRREMIDFLSNHFRYWTMRSWNKSSSYANNIKVYNVIPLHLQERVLKMMETEEFFEPITIKMSEWKNKFGWSPGFNGNSLGYIVLYSTDGVTCFSGKSIDEDADYDEWSTVELDRRCTIVQEFDKLCDDIVEYTINMAKNYGVEEEDVRKTLCQQIEKH